MKTLDPLDVEILAGAKRLADPAGCPLAEPAFAGSAGDDLDKHGYVA